MSLVVVLVFLTAIAIMGVSAVLGTLGQERMARADRDHQIAIAAAEAALRDAELDVRLNLSSSPYTSGSLSRSAAAGATNFSCACGSDLSAVQHGMCLPVTGTSCTGQSYPWAIPGNWSSNASVPMLTYTSASGTTALPLTATAPLGSSRAPRYMIEIISDVDTSICSAKATSICNVYRYRITARGWGPDSTFATLQETIQP
jgi:type IV pilus assembly protein PilX